MKSIWDKHDCPPLLRIPDDGERDLGPEVRICRNCAYWKRQSKIAGKCKFRGGDLATLPTTHPEDVCRHFEKKLRL